MCLGFTNRNKVSGLPRRPGHGLANTGLTFPVGQNMALFGAYENTEGTIEADDELVANVNGAIVASAARQVYGAVDFTYVRGSDGQPCPGAALVKDAISLDDRGPGVHPIRCASTVVCLR